MLSWRTKNSSHFINIWDTVTNVIPLHSVHQAPLYEPIFTLLAWFLRDLAYLSNMVTWANSVGNSARNVRIGSYDGACYTECNGTTFVTVSQILMKWGRFFIRHDNIWQSIPRSFKPMPPQITWSFHHNHLDICHHNPSTLCHHNPSTLCQCLSNCDSLFWSIVIIEYRIFCLSCFWYHNHAM